MKKTYCVIGHRSNGLIRVSRTWKATEREAVAHAQYLLGQRPDEMQNFVYVVKVVKVVKMSPPPTQTVNPNAFTVPGGED